MTRGTALLLTGMLAVSTVAAAPPQYVGAAKCKTCHMDEFKVWSASPHAKALGRLSAEEAKKPECVGCHVTGYEKPAAAGAALEGVQCEVCHGPGSLYKATTIMSKKVYEADKEAAHKKSLEAGLIMPTEETCKGCHNDKSPHYKAFDFKAMSEKIKHW